MPLAKEWTDKKTPEDKKAFQEYILNCGQLLDRLIEMIDKRIHEGLTAEEHQDFMSPAWAEQHAFNIGRRRALNEIRRLLDRR